MAKIVFRNVENLQANDLVGLAKTDVDLEYLTRNQDNLYKIFDVSDEDYDAVVEGTKEFDHENFSNNTPTIRTTPTSEATSLSKEEFKKELEDQIETLTDKIRARPNHSQIEKVRESLTYLESIDLDSLTYPTSGIEFKLKNNNKLSNFTIF